MSGWLFEETFGPVRKRVEEMSKEKVYLEEGQQPPRGEAVQVGPRGGHYYIYRATGAEGYTGKSSHWARSEAEARQYMDNPGFGGPYLLRGQLSNDARVYEGYDIIDDKRLRDVLIRVHKLADEVEYAGRLTWGMIEECTGRNRPYCAWEGENKVLDALRELGYDAISFEDDYPASAQTVMVLTDDAVKDVEEWDEDENKWGPQIPMTKEKVYLKPGEQPPEGRAEHVGPEDV